MKTSKLSISEALVKATELAQRLRGYVMPAFLILVTLLYGFIVYRINYFNGVQPSATVISSNVKEAKSLHVEDNVVKQLQSLQDNSVSVESLFNEARQNPFHE